MSFLFWRKKVDPAKPGHIVDLGGMSRPYEVMGPERFIYVLQNEIGMSSTRMEGLKQLVRDDAKMRAVFELIAEGAEIPEAQLVYLIREDGMNQVAWDNCLDPAWFADVATLTPTMVAVAFLFATHGKAYVRPGLPGNAYGQLLNLSAVGGIDPDRLHYMYQLAEINKDNVLAALFCVHVTELPEYLDYQKPYVRGSAPGPHGDEFFQRTHDAALRLHGILFKNHWLPAQISETEYAEACELSTEVLRELYASIWDAGYAGYRALLAAKFEAALAAG